MKVHNLPERVNYEIIYKYVINRITALVDSLNLPNKKINLLILLFIKIINSFVYKKLKIILNIGSIKKTLSMYHANFFC